MEAFVLGLMCTSVPVAQEGDLDLCTPLVGEIHRLINSTRVRPTDVHDTVVGYSGDHGSRLLEDFTGASLAGSRLTASLVERGPATGLQALSLAAQGVISGQQDVILAVSCHDGTGSRTSPQTRRSLSAEADAYTKISTARTAAVIESDDIPDLLQGCRGAAQRDAVVTSGLAVATALISNERFSARHSHPPVGRIRMTTTAAAYGWSSAEALVESAVRLLMNATLNVDDVDLWEIYDTDVEVMLDAAEKLGLDMDRVNVAGGSPSFGAAGAFRSAAIALALFPRRGLETCVILAPGPGRTAVALLLDAG